MSVIVTSGYTASGTNLTQKSPKSTEKQSARSSGMGGFQSNIRDKKTNFGKPTSQTKVIAHDHINPSIIWQTTMVAHLNKAYETKVELVKLYETLVCASLSDKDSTDPIENMSDTWDTLSELNAKNACLTDQLTKLSKKIYQAENERRQAEQEAGLSSDINGSRARKAQITDIESVAQNLEVGELKTQILLFKRQLDEIQISYQLAKNELKSSRTSMPQKVHELEEKLSDHKKENGLLHIQIQQLKDELERYFKRERQYFAYNSKAKFIHRPQLQNRQQKNSKKRMGIKPVDNEPVGKRALDKGPHDHRSLDLRNYVDGENWYSAETDGRWAGPEFVSTIFFPKLTRGKREILIEIVDALSLALVEKMVVKYGEQVISTRLYIRSDLKGIFGHFKRFIIWVTNSPRKFPLQLKGEFVVDTDPDYELTQLTFEFPEEIVKVTPARDDDRGLIARFRSILLI